MLQRKIGDADADDDDDCFLFEIVNVEILAKNLRIMARLNVNHIGKNLENWKEERMSCGTAKFPTSTRVYFK